MIKYTVYKMGRIVVNKHFDDKSLITSDKFVNKGELIISNQKGLEGIVITNNIGETFFIGPSEGAGSDVPLDYKEYVNSTVDSVVDIKLQTQGALTQVLSAATVEEFENLAIFSASTIKQIKDIEDIISGFSASTIIEINRIDNSIESLRKDFEDVAAGVIDEEYIKQLIDTALADSLEKLEGDITETVEKLEENVSSISGSVNTFSAATINEFNRIDTDMLTISGSVDTLREDLNELSAYTMNLVVNGDGGVVTGGLSKEEVEEICSEKIAEVVAGADTKYDTLKEIADWILSDETGAASMANDIANLKSQLNALTLGAKATISSSKSMIYMGEDSEITITGKLVPDSLTPCEIYIYKDVLYGEIIATGITPTVTYTETISKKSTYAIKAVYNGTSYTATTTVNAYYPTYFGFGTNYLNVMNNGTKALKSSAKGRYSETSTSDGVNYFILVPGGVTKPTTFTMGGAPFNMVSTEEFIDGVAYTVFKSGSVFNNGGSVDITAA